jgi:GNAT superfamily N-acetyltransferase
MPRPSTRLIFRPLTAVRWSDLVELFGQRGACGGCWCMYWRLRSGEFARNKGAGNRRALQRLVKSGPPPGILAYAGRRPIGWCAIAPRQDYVRLERSRVLKPIDAQPVWSVSCFFVAGEYRRRGVSVALLKAAAEFARRRGARVIEGYPVEARSRSAPPPFVWTGLPGTFLGAGFVEVARPSPSRPIMRCEL